MSGLGIRWIKRRRRAGDRRPADMTMELRAVESGMADSLGSQKAALLTREDGNGSHAHLGAPTAIAVGGATGWLAYSHRVPVLAITIGSLPCTWEMALRDGGKSVTRKTRLAPAQSSRNLGVSMKTC